jgi:hypothetical protein
LSEFLPFKCPREWRVIRATPEAGAAQSRIRQGVTTEVLGKDDSAGPRLGKLPVGGKALR